MVDLTLVIPTWNEAVNLQELLPQLTRLLPTVPESFEIIVVVEDSTDGTEQVAAANGAIVVQQSKRGYGGAWKQASENHVADTS
jgi:glycosyltransferase involved in cell wall biosynthesis